MTNTPPFLKSFLAAGIAFGLCSSPGQSVQAANDAWSTNPTSGNFSGINWTTGATTGGAATGTAATGDALFFDASTITALTNDNTGFTYAGFTFNADAAAYTIGGNAFTLTGGITNSSANVEAINTAITLGASGTSPETITVASGGTVLLGGTLTGSSTATLTTQAAAGSTTPGTLALSGSNPNYAGALIVGAGGTLQLQFNAANTTGGVSNVYTAVSTGDVLNFGNNSTLQLRGDSSASVLANNLGGFNNETVTFNVASLSGTTTGQTLSLNSNNSNFANAVTLNATGANGYILGLVKVNDVGGGTGNNLTLNPTTAGINFGGFQTSVASGTAATATLTLGGTDTSGNSNVTGLITNTVSGNATASVVIVKNNTSTWTISGSTNNYSGGTTVSAGTLILAATTAATTTTSAVGTGAVTLSGGTLQMNNNNQTLATAAFTLGGGTLNVNNTTQALGALTLASTSTLNFGAGSTAASLKFSSLASFTTGATLNITNFNTGDVFNIGTTLTSAQLAQIVDPGFTTSQNASNDNIVFTPNAVPEPSTWLALVIGSFALTIARRRRMLGVWRVMQASTAPGLDRV